MAEHDSWMNQGRQQHGWFGHGTSKLATPQNVRDLASVIETEARGTPEQARIAVGFTVLNRMRRNGADTVQGVWNGYAHLLLPQPSSLFIARTILNGAAADPTDGTTHFYTPRAMPLEGQPTGGRDVGGGLEQVAGVVADGVPVRNYRPKFAIEFVSRKIPDVPEHLFKFYRQPGDGHVR